MRYYRCKCGGTESWGSMGPTPCQRCKKCGSNLAGSPESHREPEPHKWMPSTVETDEGDKILTVCVWCGVSKRELDQAKVTE